MKLSIFMALTAAVLAGCGGAPDIAMGDNYNIYLYDNENVPGGCTFHGYVTIDDNVMLQYACVETGADHE